MHLRATHLFLLVLLAMPATRVLAEDAPAAGEDPSPLAELTEEQLQGETQPTNPVEFLRAFYEWLVKHEVAPPRSRLDTALHDVWRAALRPRASRMSSRIEKLMKRKYWLPDEGEPTHVQPAEWSRFVREIAGLMTELHGAWKQYVSARILVKRGIPVQRLRPVGTYYGYGLSFRAWRRAHHRRIAVGAKHAPVKLGKHAPGASPGTGTLPPGTAAPVHPGRVHKRVGFGVHLGRGELYSYWHLLHRYRLGWDWRVRHCYDCELRRLEAQRAREDYIAERQRIFDTTRDTLQQQMLSLQVLTAAMQAQAEHHLNAELAKIEVDATRASADLQAKIDDVMNELREARLAAERYQGDSSAQYGHLLRQWVRHYKQANALLEKAKQPADESDGG